MFVMWVRRAAAYLSVPQLNPHEWVAYSGVGASAAPLAPSTSGRIVL